MNPRDVIAAADPARALPRAALDLDVDALLQEFAARPDAAPPLAAPTPVRRRRLDLALAAVLAAILSAIALVPGSFPHDSTAGRSTSSPSTSSAEARAAAEALLDGIRLPAAADPIASPPTGYLSRQWQGLACKGTVSAGPRYWIVPGTTLAAVARYLRAHRPAGARTLRFNHDTESDIASAFTVYRPASTSQVVIALSRTTGGIGIRADADAAPGGTCVDPSS